MTNEINILETIEHIASIAAAVAIIYTAWIGNLQLKRWKKEKLFDRRAEHAIKIVKMMHRARDIIHKARFPIVMPDEYEEACDQIRRLGFSESDISKYENLVKSRALLNRLEKEREFFLKISNYAPIARIIFDITITIELNEMVNIYYKIRNATWISFGTKDMEEKLDNIKRLFSVLGEEDKIKIEIDSIITRIESKIQKVMGTNNEKME